MTDRTRIQRRFQETPSRTWVGPVSSSPLDKASVQVTRRVRIPDGVRLERFRRTPEIGPRLLCFGGYPLSEPFGSRLVRHTHNAIHILPSGPTSGPGARMSRSFRMPAVESLAGHLLQLADPWSGAVEDMVAFLEFRFPEHRTPPRLRSRLRRMSRGANGPIDTLPNEVSTLVRGYLESFVGAMPATLDLRGIGMLEILLAGGYLRHGGQLDSVVYLFSRLLGIRGRVRPVFVDDLGILAELADGSLIEISPGDPRWKERAGGEGIRRIHAGRRTRDALSTPSIRVTPQADGEDVGAALPDDEGPEGLGVVEVTADPQAEELIRSAEVLCYPPGRFFSGLLATLFPSGVGRAVAESGAPKVWVPDTDPETEGAGLSLSDRLILLLAHVQRGERDLDRRTLVDCVLVDPGAPGVHEAELRKIEDMGFDVVRLPLGTSEGGGLDGSLLAEALLSLG